MVHSDEFNLLEYEVAKGVYVTIRYDLAGSAPGQAKVDNGTLQPQDRVMSLPIIAETSAGKELIYKAMLGDAWKQSAGSQEPGALK
jgi:hypothetical protein